MVNPLLLLGGAAKPLPAPPARPNDQKIVTATVSRIEGEAVFVNVQEFSGVYSFGPLKAPEGWAPALGEECLVGFDQNSTAYALWPSAPFGALIASLQGEVSTLTGAVAKLTADNNIYSSLPAEPYDGQVIRYRAQFTSGNSDGPVLWTLRYNAASTSSHKWESAGGAALYVSGNEAKDGEEWEVAAANVLEPIKNTGTFTTPFAGQWDIRSGVMAVLKKEPCFLRISPTYVGGGGTSVALDGSVSSQFTSNAAGAQNAAKDNARTIDVGAGTTLELGIILSAKQKLQTWQPHMLITPVRVG